MTETEIDDSPVFGCRACCGGAADGYFREWVRANATNIIVNRITAFLAPRFWDTNTIVCNFARMFLATQDLELSS